MSHALVQRKSINLCRPLLRTLDFACQPYPQFVSESHDTVSPIMHPGPTFIIGR
jgi:hypothetical protein